MLSILTFSAIAGICGTGLGGLIAALLSKRQSNFLICAMLSFAAGVMISIVCFELVVEAIELSSWVWTVYGLIFGIVIVMLLNRVVDNITNSKEKLHSTPEELYHESPIIVNKKLMFRSGLFMLLAIGLHNLPEGIAIGAGGTHDAYFGGLLSLIIALHNIPEGMAIAGPLLAGGLNKKWVVFLTALSGTPTLIGGLLGIALGSISPLTIAICLSAAGGAMLYVVFGEIIPQAVVLTKSRIATIIMMGGIILGFVLTQLHL